MKRYDLVTHKDEGGAVEERDAGEFVKYEDHEKMIGELIDNTLKVCEESISYAERADVNKEIAMGFRHLIIAIMKESLHCKPFGEPCTLGSSLIKYFVKDGTLYRRGSVYQGRWWVEDVLEGVEDLMNHNDIIQPVKFTKWEIPNA